MDRTDISVITTMHREGSLMRASLLSITTAINDATHHNLKVEWLLVLDSADDDTRKFLQSNMPSEARLITLECKDVGAARNAAMACANGSFIAISDADDLWSTNWLSSAHSFATAYGKPVILHPKCMIQFGITDSIVLTVDSDSIDFSPLTFLDMNHWSSNTFTQKSLHLEFPFCTSFDTATGLGFEDWHFHCETLAAGIHHKAVDQTFHCYRVKRTEDSLSGRSFMSNLLVPPSKLFALPYQKPNGLIKQASTDNTSPKQIDTVFSDVSEVDRLRTLINNSRLFDEDFYRTNPGVGIITGDPITHYLTQGWKQGYEPNALFDTRYYRAQYPNLSSLPICALVHYLQKGIFDRKEINAHFDSQFYLNRYPEVAQCGLTAVAHYLHFGAEKGYDPSARFNTSYYLLSSPDVAEANMNPLAHYLHFGKLEGRSTTAIDENLIRSITQYYSRAKEIEPLLQPLEHLCNKGRRHIRLSLAGPAYGKLISTLSEPFTHLFSLSGIGWTITEQRALDFARQLRKKNGEKSVLVVCTDKGDRLVAQMFADHARVVYFDDLEVPLDYKARMIMLTRLVLQANPKVFHIFESTIGWLALKSHHRQLKSARSQIYGYLPADNIDNAGNLKGTAVSFFGDCVDNLDGVIFDNNQLFSALYQHCGLEQRNQSKFIMLGLAFDEVKGLDDYW